MTILALDDLMSTRKMPLDDLCVAIVTAPLATENDRFPHLLGYSVTAVKTKLAKGVWNKHGSDNQKGKHGTYEEQYGPKIVLGMFLSHNGPFRFRRKDPPKKAPELLSGISQTAKHTIQSPFRFLS